MKLNRQNLFLLASLTLTLSAPSASAADTDGTWLGITGNWSAPTTWNGGILADGAGFTANFTGVNITANQTITVDAVRTIGNITFTDDTTASHNLTIDGASILTLDVTTGAPIIDVTQSGRTLTISAQIAGNDGLTKNGLGNLILSGNNTYSGVTTIDGGATTTTVGLLTVSSATALGSTTGGTTFIAGTNSSTTASMTLGAITVTGESLTVQSNGGRFAFNGNSGTSAWAGNVTIDPTAVGFLQFQTSGNLTFGASATDTFTTSASASSPTFRGTGNITVESTIQGDGNISKTDVGVLKLTAANTHSGTSTNSGGNGGKYLLANSLALQNSTYSVTNTGTIANSLTFDSSVVSNAFTLGGLSATASGNAKNFALENNASAAIALSVGNNNADTTYNGVMSGAGSLTKIGTGILTLGGANTYTGTTAVRDGTLVLDTAANRLATTAAVVLGDVATTGKLVLGGTTAANQTLRTLTATGLGGSVVGGNADVSTLTLSQNANFTYAGNLGGAGTHEDNLALVKSGGFNDLILTGTNTYTGGTSVNNGRLFINGAGALPTTGAVQVKNGARLAFSSAGTFDQSITLESGATLGARTTGVILNNVILPTAGIINFNRDNAATAGFTLASDVALTGNLTVEVGGGSTPTTEAVTLLGDFSEGFGLTKSQPGTLTLAGTNSYTGTTTVTAGTLAVTGTLGATAVTVDSPATLGGNGNIGGDVTINAGATHALAVAATPGAQVTRAITGTLTLTPGNLLNLTAAATPAAGEYVLATADTITGTTAEIDINYNGISGTVSVDTASNPDRLLLTAVASGFSAWIEGPFTNAIPLDQQGPNDDPDNDGISNLVEFAVANQDPTVGNTNISTFDGTTLSFDKRQLLEPSLTYVIEESIDLGSPTAWTPVTGGVNSSTIISYALTPGTPVRNFLRLQVISN